MSKRDKQGKFVQRSLSQQAWIQFRSNRLAICGLVVIALLILVSITTILIDLTDGGELYKVLVTKNNLPMKLASPLPRIPWGAMNLEEICCSGFYGERAIHFLPVFVRFWLPSLQAVCLVLLRDFTAGKLIMSSCALWIW